MGLYIQSRRVLASGSTLQHSAARMSKNGDRRERFPCVMLTFSAPKASILPIPRNNGLGYRFQRSEIPPISYRLVIHVLWPSHGSDSPTLPFFEKLRHTT